jgi:predicted dehydrogenase
VDKLKLERSAKNIVEKYYADKKDGSYKGCSRYHNFRELLARPDIDAVVISTPDHWHAVTTIEACRAGKDIYCEKPLTQTIAEAQAMVKTIRQYGRVFQTGSMQRSSREFCFACELVRNGYIGDIKHVTVNVGGPPEDKVLPPEPVPEYLDWDMWVGPAMWRPGGAGPTHQWRRMGLGDTVLWRRRHDRLERSPLRHRPVGWGWMSGRSRSSRRAEMTTRS